VIVELFPVSVGDQTVTADSGTMGAEAVTVPVGALPVIVDDRTVPADALAVRDDDRTLPARA
jgi:hypothetical protein